jgi:hypothetical protein
MRTLRFLSAGLLLAGMLRAETWTGDILDVLCRPENVAVGAKKCQQNRACMLSDRCASSGYGVLLANGRFLKFDAAGSAKALKLLKAMTKDTNLKVTVTGHVTRESRWKRWTSDSVVRQPVSSARSRSP